MEEEEQAEEDRKTAKEERWQYNERTHVEDDPAVKVDAAIIEEF